MTKPYGKLPKKPARKTKQRESEPSAFKIKIRGKDNAPLSQKDVSQGLYEAARRLQKEGCRAKWITLYVAAIDENGEDVRIGKTNEITIYPYQSAADERGV